MQYHSCVCILWHAEPRIGGAGGGCIPLYLVKVHFWDSYFIFWKKKEEEKKKKKKRKPDPLFSKFWVGQKRANKHIFFGGGPHTEVSYFYFVNSHFSRNTAFNRVILLLPFSIFFSEKKKSPELGLILW